MKRMFTTIIALALMVSLLLVPSVVIADTPFPPGAPLPPSLPLMIEGNTNTSNELVTIEINGDVFETTTLDDGKFYIPLSGKEGDIITFTLGDIVLEATYINPMENPFLEITLTAPTLADIIRDAEPTGEASYYDDDDNDTKVKVKGFTEEDIAWIIAHGGYIY